MDGENLLRPKIIIEIAQSLRKSQKLVGGWTEPPMRSPKVCEIGSRFAHRIGSTCGGKYGIDDTLPILGSEKQP